MSTPESNKIVQNTIHSNGAIRKGLLTPYRRIGLSRKKQAYKSNYFVSPLQSKEIIPVDNISLSPVGYNSTATTSEDISITPTLQNKCKRTKNVSNKIYRKINNEENEHKLSNTIKESSLQGSEENVDVDEELQSKSLNNELEQSIEKTKVYDYKESLNNCVDDHDYYVRNAKQKLIRSLNQNDDSYGNQEVIDKNLKDIVDVEFKKKTKEVSNQIQIDNPTIEESINIESTTSKNKLCKDRKKRLFDNHNSEEIVKGFINAENLCKISEQNKIKKHLNEPKSGTFKRRKIFSLQNDNNEENIIQSCNIELDQKKEKVSENGDMVYDMKNISLEMIQNKDEYVCSSNYNLASKEISSTIYNHETFEIERGKMSLQDDIPTSNKQDLIDSNIKSNEKSTRHFKRKLSLKKNTQSSNLNKSSEISNTLSEQETIKEIIQGEDSEVIDKIIKLEKIVDNKEDELRRLEQAQIYRTIHKIDNLKIETQIWKDACQEALSDLLIKLKDYNPIDMNSLLLKLKVPSSLFTYDAENDCFL